MTEGHRERKDQARGGGERELDACSRCWSFPVRDGWMVSWWVAI